MVFWVFRLIQRRALTEKTRKYGIKAFSNEKKDLMQHQTTDDQLVIKARKKSIKLNETKQEAHLPTKSKLL